MADFVQVGNFRLEKWEATFEISQILILCICSSKDLSRISIYKDNRIHIIFLSLPTITRFSRNPASGLKTLGHYSLVCFICFPSLTRDWEMINSEEMFPVTIYRRLTHFLCIPLISLSISCRVRRVFFHFHTCRKAVFPELYINNGRLSRSLTGCHLGGRGGLPGSDLSLPLQLVYVACVAWV